MRIWLINFKITTFFSFSHNSTPKKRTLMDLEAIQGHIPGFCGKVCALIY